MSQKRTLSNVLKNLIGDTDLDTIADFSGTTTKTLRNWLKSTKPGRNQWATLILIANLCNADVSTTDELLEAAGLLRFEHYYGLKPERLKGVTDPQVDLEALTDAMGDIWQRSNGEANHRFKYGSGPSSWEQYKRPSERRSQPMSSRRIRDEDPEDINVFVAEGVQDITIGNPGPGRRVILHWVSVSAAIFIVAIVVSTQFGSAGIIESLSKRLQFLWDSTPTATPTIATPTATLTPAVEATMVPSATVAPSIPTETAIPLQTETPTELPTETATPNPTATPTDTPDIEETVQARILETQAAAFTPDTVTPTKSKTPTLIPTSTFTLTPTGTFTPIPLPTVTATMAVTNTPIITADQGCIGITRGIIGEQTVPLYQTPRTDVPTIDSIRVGLSVSVLRPTASGTWYQISSQEEGIMNVWIRVQNISVPPNCFL